MKRYTLKFRLVELDCDGCPCGDEILREEQVWASSVRDALYYLAIMCKHWYVKPETEEIAVLVVRVLKDTQVEGSDCWFGSPIGYQYVRDIISKDMYLRRWLIPA